jgi:hypothetical protein
MIEREEIPMVIVMIVMAIGVIILVILGGSKVYGRDSLVGPICSNDNTSLLRCTNVDEQVKEKQCELKTK